MCGLAGQLSQDRFKTCVGWQVSSHKIGSRLVWAGRSAPTRSVQDLCGLAGQLPQDRFKACVGWQVSSHKISSRLVWAGRSAFTRSVQDLCGLAAQLLQDQFKTCGLAGQLSQGQFKTCVGWQVSSHKTGSRPVGAGLPAMAPWKSSRVFRIKTVHVQQNPHPATRLRPAQSPLS